MWRRFSWLLVLTCGAVPGCRSEPARSAACAGIPCSGHGRCAVVRGDPACACDPGYRPEGLNCLPFEGPAAAPAAAAAAAVPDATAPGGGPAAPPAAGAARAADELCALAADVLARPDAGGAAELAVPAKRDAVALYRTAIVADCADFVRDAGFGAEAIACGIRTLRQTLQEEVDLGTLGGRDPAAAACGETWKGELDVHAAEFQRLLLAQRDRFGVAVFGFHRQYGFAGGAGEEFCRRFAAALPGAPRALLEPGGELPEAWRALLRSCGEIISGFELRPLLRWCIVDRADEILGRGTAEPCEPFAGPGDVDGLRQIVRELRALGPAANTRTPAARPPSGTSGEASGAAGTRILTGYPGDDDRERVSGTRAPAPSHDARPPSTGGRTTLIDTSFP